MHIFSDIPPQMKHTVFAIKLNHYMCGLPVLWPDCIAIVGANKVPAGTNNPRDHQHYRVFQPVGEVSSNSSFSWRAEVAVEIEPVTRGVLPYIRLLGLYRPIG